MSSSGKPLGCFLVSNLLERSIQPRKVCTYGNKTFEQRLDSSKPGPPGRPTSQHPCTPQTPRYHIPVGLVVVGPLRKTHLQGTQRAGLLKLMSRTLPSDVIASPLWHSATPATTDLAMERIQASIARTVLRAHWMTPKDQLLQQLAWPSLRWRRTVASLAMFHKLLHMQHTPLSTCIPPHLSELSSRSRRKPLDVRLPPTRTSRYTKSFFFHCSLLWNSLPSSLQCIKSSTLFQHNLEVYWAQYKYSAFRQKFPKLWTSVAHSFLQQIA